jgi:hypothetical protein
MPGATKRRFQLPTELQQERIVSMTEAAEISGLSIDSWKRHYRHLIIRLSARRLGVKLKDALRLGQPAETPLA